MLSNSRVVEHKGGIGTHTGRFSSKHKNFVNVPKSCNGARVRQFMLPQSETQLIECSFPGADPYPSVDIKFHSTFPGITKMKAYMEYRELESGETIKVGDEWRLTAMKYPEWRPVVANGPFVGMLCHPVAVRIRRKVEEDGETATT